ncbi:MAG: hypothetical protein E6R05_02835 [Candidatus Moraniibacteriota bacterium]|nr:MAG: hypothetical protein E6R05_02835 [Candidatus Moranbacteria bacterium]
MRESHYIDIDEEIISAVSRLRQSGQTENVFIFPKRALILQSIVNLRLLEREARKLGKQIIVVSQDEIGKKLAERAGLRIEAYQDQNFQEQTAVGNSRFVVEPGADPMPLPEVSIRPKEQPRSTDIGSDDFFAATQSRKQTNASTRPLVRPEVSGRIQEIAPNPPRENQPQPLRVRNASPAPLTSLNSLRGDVRPPRSKFASVDQMPQSVTTAPRGPALPMPVVTRPSMPIQTEQGQLEKEAARARLSRFMGGAGNVPTPLTQSSKEVYRGSHPLSTSPRSHAGWLTLIPLGIFIVLLIAGGWYILFPKANIILKPQTAEQIVRFQITGLTETTTNTDSIPVRMLSLEKTVRVSEIATSETSGTEATKARGRIRISNTFSSTPQPLVATTRFETKEGKVYRLVDSLVVPGTKEQDGKSLPGVVEAVVVADQSGADYNLGSATFTIPGFKGSAKYEKFSAEIVQAFTGGSAPGGTTGKKVVGQTDIEKARKKALDEARSHALEEAKRLLQTDEILIDESLELVEKSGTSTPLLGASAEQFDYEARFEAKVFALNPKSINERIEKERVQMESVTLVPVDYTTQYVSLLPKYESGRIDMTVENTVRFQAPLDGAKLKSTLLGLNEEGMKDFLKDHPEVERLQVEFQPQLFISTIPSDEARVTVTIE